MAIIYPSINTSNFATNSSNTFTGNQDINGNINLTGSLVNGNSKVSITSGNSGSVASFSDTNRSGKFTAMIETTTGTYHVQACELLLSNNGSSALITPYAFTSTSGGYLATFNASLNSGIIIITATNLSGQNINVTMTKTFLI